ncbi:MAG: DUF1573 domain-containing protein [Bacteroidia bacterium]|nr:DUF1573 domain-containing protein [Bacteroidia bacterium]
MKKAVFLSMVLLTGLIVYSQASGQPFRVLSAVFSWQKTTHDFGSMRQKPVTAVFTFTNTGDAPLVITDAKGSCGCTVPSYTKDPIMPGEQGEIKAVYNAASVGVFNKTVTVTANTDKAAVLTIKGEVVAKQQSNN